MRLRVDNIPVTIVTNTNASEPFTLGAYEHATVHIGPVWTTAYLGLLASPTKTGTYVSVVNTSHQAYGRIAWPSSAHALPSSYLGGLRWVRLVSHSNGEPILQAADVTVHVTRKG